MIGSKKLPPDGLKQTGIWGDGDGATLNKKAAGSRPAAKNLVRFLIAMRCYALSCLPVDRATNRPV
jgi:hypothetical protein